MEETGWNKESINCKMALFSLCSFSFFWGLLQDLKAYNNLKETMNSKDLVGNLRSFLCLIFSNSTLTDKI